MMIALRRALTFALKDFWRNIWLSLATTSILVLALISVNVLFILNTLADEAIRTVEDRVDVSVYFKPEASEQLANDAATYVRSLPQVKSVTVRTKDEALALLKEREKGNAAIIESLTVLEGNPLGHTLQVKARDPGSYAAILAALDHPTYAPSIASKNIENHERIIARIRNIAGRVGEGAAIVTGIFALIAALVIFNSVRIAVYTHRDEVRIMRLVGASNSFIRAPFFIETALYTLIAALVSFAVIIGLLSLATPRIAGFLGNADFSLLAHFLAAPGIFILEVAGVLAISLAASAIALRQYLKV